MSSGSHRLSAAIRNLACMGIVVPALLLMMLAWHPDTAWLLRAQWRLLFSSRDAYVVFKEVYPRTPPAPEPQWFRDRLKEVARQHPEDYLIQLSWNLQRGHISDVDLRDLLPRFGSRPSLLAHILRYDTVKRVRIQRLEEWAFYPPSERPNPQSLPPPSPQSFAAYDRIAAEGEQVDPDNAYFPLMRAAGLFAVRRDEEALAAVRRASRKSRWEDYTREEVEAHLRLLETAFGKQSAICAFLKANEVVEPHWMSIRSVARMVRYLAHEKEKAGKQHEAADIRLAMLRSTSLIRAQASSYIGAPVAIAAGNVAIAAPSLTRRPNETEEQRWLRMQQQFLASLRRIGRDADALWAQREFAAMSAARTILRTGAESRQWLQMPLRLVRAWSLNMLLLFLFLGTLLFWLVYVVVARTSLRRGMAPYIVLLATALGAGVLTMLSPWADFPGRTLVTLAEIAKWEDAQPEFMVVSPFIFRAATAMAVVFLLLMLVTAVGIWGLVRSREPNVALVDGVQRGGLPIAGVILMLYLLSVRHTVRVESAWQNDLQVLRQHAGKYYASQLGTMWPP